MSPFIKNTSIYTIGSLLPSLVTFLLLPVFSKYLTPEDYGIVSAMETLTYILAIFFTLTLERAAYRFFFDYKDDIQRKELLGTLFISTSIISAILLIILFLSQHLVQKIFSTIPFTPYYVYAILSCFLTSFTLIPSAYLQVMERAKTFIIFKLGNFFLNTILSLWFIVHWKEGAEGYLKAGFIAALLILPTYLLIIREFKWKFHLQWAKDAIHFAWPFIPTLLMAWILNLSDRIFIERFLSLHEVGIYSMGYKISMIFFVFTSAYATAYHPTFYKLANSENQEIAKQKLKRYSFFSIGGYFIMGFMIAWFSNELVTFMLDKQYNKSHEIIRLIIFSHIFAGIAGMTTSLFVLQAKKSKENMYLSFLTGGTNIILNFCLIPPFGIYGAAIATVATLMLAFIIQYEYSKKCYFIPLPLREIAIWTISMAIILSIYHFWLEQWFWVAFGSKIVICGGVLLYVFINWNELKMKLS